MKITPADLKQVSIFEELPAEDLTLLLSSSVVRAVEEDSFFFLQGDTSTHTYILTSGRVKLFQTAANGQQVGMRVAHAWEVFGAIGVMQARAPYPVSAQAMQDSQALAWDTDTFRGFIKERPQTTLALSRMMAGFVREMQERYREVTSERVEQRLARAVLRLASGAGRKVEDGVVIDLELTRQDLAEMTGTTLFTASRVLADWERQGLIEAGREHITIRNLHGLVKISEGLER